MKDAIALVAGLTLCSGFAYAESDTEKEAKADVWNFYRFMLAFYGS